MDADVVKRRAQVLWRLWHEQQAEGSSSEVAPFFRVPGVVWWWREREAGVESTEQHDAGVVISTEQHDADWLLSRLEELVVAESLTEDPAALEQSVLACLQYKSDDAMQEELCGLLGARARRGRCTSGR